LFGADRYLFTSFRRNGETGVFFALSDDGRKWRPLNGNQPWIKPVEPGMLMRDPWLGQGPDGVWHMLWTWGWSAKDMGGKLKIGYANSKGPDSLVAAARALRDGERAAGSQSVGAGSRVGRRPQGMGGRLGEHDSG